jgi:6-pyruvoyltetrahydropterin/6-carboxytetrahydropterin synthase
MYSLCVRDHVMIAHSFHGAVFGPAQGLHGATYVVDLEFRRSQLDPDNLVVDIGLASRALRGVLAEIDYRNLDEIPDLAGQNTTTEFMARRVFDGMAGLIAAGELGAAARGIQSLRVVLHESHLAWAAYEAQLPGLASEPAA